MIDLLYFLRQLIRRDMILSFKKSAETFNIIGFFISAVMLFPFALGTGEGMLRPIAAGIIWVMALLAILLGLPGLYQADMEDGTLEQYLLLPVALEWIALAKTIALWLSVCLPLALLSPLLALMLQLPPENAPALMGSLMLGTLPMAFIGSLGAALLAGRKRGGVLLSLLILPLYVPVLIFGAAAVNPAIAADQDATPWRMLLAFALSAPLPCCLTGAALLRLAVRE